MASQISRFMRAVLGVGACLVGHAAAAEDARGECEWAGCWKMQVSNQLLDRVGLRSGALDLPQVRVEPALWSAGGGHRLDVTERQAVRSGVLRGELSLRADTFRETQVSAEGAEARLLSQRWLLRSDDTRRFLNVDFTDAQYTLGAPGVPTLRLRQFAPSVGFRLSDAGDWMTLRVYDVRSQGVGGDGALRTRAVETRWVRQITAPRGGPSELQVSSLFGNRLHAVDPDSASIFSLADMQKGGLAVGTAWQVSPHAKWVLNGGYDVFEQGGAGGPEYANTYVFTGLKGRW